MIIFYGRINFDGESVKNYSTKNKYYLSGRQFLLCWDSKFFCARVRSCALSLKAVVLMCASQFANYRKKYVNWLKRTGFFTELFTLSINICI